MGVRRDEAPQGFLNNSLVGLGLLFIIPALLVVGGFVLVAMQGRVPGGTSTTCERVLSEEVQIRIDQYQYMAGLTTYADQTFSISRDGGGTWEQIFTDNIQVPKAVTCEDNIGMLDDGILWVFNQKTVAFSNDANSWEIQNVCDEPRPNTGRCDSDPLNIITIDWNRFPIVNITIQEGVVDEYGQPIFEQGSPRILSEYTLTTLDGGQSWQLSSNG